MKRYLEIDCCLYCGGIEGRVNNCPLEGSLGIGADGPINDDCPLPTLKDLLAPLRSELERQILQIETETPELNNRWATGYVAGMRGGIKHALTRMKIFCNGEVENGNS